MAELLKPLRGGFQRRFGCGWFIREFLSGHGPEGSPRINPVKGAPQADIKFEYKEALYRAMARDRADREISDLVKAGVDVSSEEAVEIERKHYRRIPAKTTRMRYHSFMSYFNKLKMLGWVEATGETEPSTFQDSYPAAPPRVYYRLTEKGKAAADREWSNPLLALYPQFSLEGYFRGKRNEGRRR
ncbi:MAG: hypothetical protein WC749_09470 [Dehalococcoidia bacterium]